MDSARTVKNDMPITPSKNTTNPNVLGGYDGDIIILGGGKAPMAHGYGTWTFKTGKVIGRWALGNPVGIMSMSYKSGQDRVIYIGELKIENGKCIAHGNGKQERTSPDGDVRIFDGKWSDGKFVNGKATMGKLENDQINMTNTIFDGNFDSCTGTEEIIKGTRNCDGYGPTGGRLTEKYEGEFKNWRAHGTGTLTRTSESTQTTATGTFDADSLYSGIRDSSNLKGLSEREVLDRNKIVMTYRKSNPNEIGTFQIWQPHGKGEIMWLNGDKYEGEFKNGLPDGFGTIKWNSGDKNQHSYTGNFVNGKRTGEGTYQWLDGKTCQGNWNAGIPTGDVTIRFPNKTIYQGPVNAKLEPHGVGGKMTFSDRTCEGSWFNGNPAKNMSLTYSDGSQYSGRVNNQWQPNGLGTMVLPDGTAQTGNWENGKLKSTPAPAQPKKENSHKAELTIPIAQKVVPRKDRTPNLLGEYQGDKNASGQPNGQGVMQLKDGTLVSGNWADGRPNGEMKIVYPDQRNYVGPIGLKNNKYHPNGKGVMNWPDGRLCQGSWDFGTPVEKMIIFYFDGTQFKGELNSNYQPHGIGIMSWPDSYTEKSCKGSWENGIPKKEVTLNFHDGRVFTGLVNSSYEMNGQGKLTWLDDNVVSCVGCWRDGEPLGQVALNYLSGDSYQGKVDSQYRPDGKNGKYTWHDGKIYEGENKAGKPNGNGSYKIPGRFSYIGSIVAGQMHGHGILHFENGERFEGNFNQGQIEGPGKLFIDEFTYECDNFTLLATNELDFEAVTISWKNGHYQGAVKDGMPFGNGELTWRGKVYPGPFDEKQEKFLATLQFPSR